MEYPLLLPTSSAKRLKPPGGGSFWGNFWKSFDKTSQYSERVKTNKSSVTSIYQNFKDKDRKIYAEVRLNDGAKSKSNKPKEIWTQAGLDVVLANEKNNITVSGKKDNYQRLEKILSNSSFSLAKEGKGVAGLLSREAYTIESVADLNTKTDSRISRDLQDLLINDPQKIYDCIIEVYSDQKLSEYSNLFLLLKAALSDQKVQERNQKLFITNMSFKAQLNEAEIKSLLQNEKYNFICKIRLTKQFLVQRCIPNSDISNLKIGKPLTEETIAIFDSGVEHALLNPLVGLKYNFIGKKDADKDHGTFVASRLMFGDQIFNQIGKSSTIQPIGKIMDVQVVFKDPHSLNKTRIDEDALLGAILEISERHTDVKIYNLSLNDFTQADGDTIDDLTQLLDTVGREKDIIIVCSAGNNACYPSAKNCIDLFSDPSQDTGIASPGDALNVISVGSIAAQVSAETYCKEKNHPSPFTRKGGGHKNWKKPELVMDGGNIQFDSHGVYNDAFMTASCKKYGVEGVNTTGLHKDIGTSFSTPLVTRQCAQLLDYLRKSNLLEHPNSKGNISNVVKALLIHSTSRITQSKFESGELRTAYGFGIPDFKEVLYDNQNQITSVYLDQISNQEKKHSISIKLPEALLGHKLKITFTLVYNPPVDKNFPREYKMTSVRPSLRFVRPKDGVGSKQKFVQLSARHTWDHFRSVDFNVCHFDCSINKLKYLDLEVLLQMFVTEHFESSKMITDFKQPYSIIVTITDLDSANIFRQEMLKTKQFEEIITQMIEVKT